MHTKAYQEEGVYKDNLYDPGKQGLLIVKAGYSLNGTAQPSIFQGL